MSIVMLALLALILGTGGGAALVIMRQLRKAQPPQLPQHTATRHALNLQLNDVVIHMDAQYLVEGRVTFEEAGQRWFTYRLVDGDVVRWLRARPGDEAEVTLLEEVAPLTEEARPPQSLTWEGATFKLKGWGQARTTFTGAHTRPNVARCEYHDYQGPGDRVITIELWGPEQTCSLAGRELEPYLLEFMPGDAIS